LITEDMSVFGASTATDIRKQREDLASPLDYFAV